MSHSTKKICGGPWACCGNKAVKAWKRTNHHKYRRLIKNRLALEEDYESPGDFKKITDSWGPRDGSTIYWTSKKDAELSSDWALEAYKKALRK